MSGPEKKIETYLVKRCKEIGGVAEKFTSVGKRAVPDRICQFPYNIIVFVELKAEGKKPTPLQEHDHKIRRSRGHHVKVLDSKAEVDGFIDGILEIMDMKSEIEGLL